MEISWMRLYFLAGLLFHKAVWEYMKTRQGGSPPRKAGNPKTKLLSMAKLGILLGIIVQCMAPAILPISSQPALLERVGTVLYTIGLLTAVTGRIQLGWNWSDIEKSSVNRGHEVVSHGVYRYIRHPIYAGDLLLLLGLELALNSWCVLGVAAIAVYVRRKAVYEERQLKKALPEYAQYCRRTARFVPFLPV